jgi:hypothetical protein
MQYNINVTPSTMKKLMMILALASMLPTANAGDANWPMGSANGGWAMGTPDDSWPMTADDANHVVKVGYTKEQVSRAVGAPLEISKVVDTDFVMEVWRYDNGIVTFQNGIVTRIQINY